MGIMYFILLVSFGMIQCQMDTSNMGISSLVRLHQAFNNKQTLQTSQKDDQQPNTTTFSSITSTGESILSTNDARDSISLNISSKDSTETNQQIYYPRKPSPGNSVLDNLFEMHAKEIEKEENSPPPLDLILTFEERVGDLPNLLIDMYNNPTEDKFNTSSVLMTYLDDVRADAWTEFKKMVMQYTGFMDDYYQELSHEERIPVNLIRKVLDLGDKVNFVHLFGKKVDPQLLHFIMNKLQPLAKEIPYFDSITHLFKGSNSIRSPISRLMKTAALKTLQQFAQYIINSAHPHVSQTEIMQYYNNLKISNPIAASGLKLILQLNEDGKKTEDGTPSLLSPNGLGEETSSLLHSLIFNRKNNKKEAVSSRQYNDMSSTDLTLDPYLLLAGIGAAALLTFVAFRIIVTTKRRKKREVDFGLINESDTPTILTYVYNMIDDHEAKYDSPSSSESLVHNLNELWHQSQTKDGCTRCELFSYLKNEMISDVNYINTIIAAGVAELLGVDRPGQLADQIMTQFEDGNKDLMCKRSDNTCVFE